MVRRAPVLLIGAGLLVSTGLSSRRTLSVAPFVFGGVATWEPDVLAFLDEHLRL
jgi:hypothetical protein